MRKFLVDKHAHMCGAFRLSERLSRASKDALIAVLDAQVAGKAKRHG